MDYRFLELLVVTMLSAKFIVLLLEGIFYSFIIENYSTFNSVDVFGAIGVNEGVVRVYFLDVEKFLLID